jgi:hypothetical protein
MQCQWIYPIKKLKMTFGYNGKQMMPCNSINEVHSHMDHSWKWLSTIMVNRFTTKVVNVHGVDMCLLLSTCWFFWVYSCKKIFCSCKKHFAIVFIISKFNLYLKSSWKHSCKGGVFLLMFDSKFYTWFFVFCFRAQHFPHPFF